jgi:hypothetical protein
MSCVDDSSITGELTLPAPKEWLQAWMACYGNEQEPLRCAGIKEVVNCLLVRFSFKSAARLAWMDMIVFLACRVLGFALRSQAMTFAPFSATNAKCLKNCRPYVRNYALMPMPTHVPVSACAVSERPPR